MIMRFIDCVVVIFIVTHVAADPINRTALNTSNSKFASDEQPSGNDVPHGDQAYNDTLPSAPTRRILRGFAVGHTRPYMVYLRPAKDERDYELFESHWLCGGVIIHPRYILTSAACIEDVGNFYVVSGTHKFVQPYATNECITNGAKKAVWKCVPRSYFFDGDAFDNIRWMVGDIAVVRVEDDFNFERRIKGCDFVPKMIAYNNRTKQLERSGVVGSVAGWGTTEKYINQGTFAFNKNSAIGVEEPRVLVNSTGIVEENCSISLAIDSETNHPRLRNGSKYAINSVQLLESNVMLISRKGCRKHWDERYHFIIQQEMICTKDSTDYEPVAAACLDHGIDCKEVGHSDEDYYGDQAYRRKMGDHDDQEELLVHTAAHQIPTRRSRLHSGGFCENDHGGPLVLGQGKSSVVIGIMSACLTRQISHRCYGPFLYTSVYKYRGLISCAIDKTMQQECRTILKGSHTQIRKTVFDWRGRFPLTSQVDSDDEQPRRWHTRERVNNQIPLNQNSPGANIVGNQSISASLLKTWSANNTYETTEDSFDGIRNVIMRRFYNKQ